jgi:hypothetical protein
VGHSSGSVFAWIILRGVSLGFFSGSRVFFSFGFRGSCWGVFGVGLGAFRVFFFLYSGVTIGGFFCFVKVSIMLVRGFLVSSLWFYWVFYVG